MTTGYRADILYPTRGEGSGVNKKELLDRFARSGEERVLLARVLDKLELSRSRGVPAHTSFLSPGEQALVTDLLNACGRPRHHFWGGYPDSERNICFFPAQWQEPDDVLTDPEGHLTAVQAKFPADASLTHRDILGALMGMGVRRDTVGDILVGKESCDLIVLPSVAGFLKDNLTSAGRVRLRVEQIGLDEIDLPVQQRKTLHDTVAALRLDSVLAVGFSISRSKAAQLIAAGRCAVNWRETTKSDLALREGDVISCRGLGKCKLTEVGGLSRKGRINITMERYL